MRRTAVALFFFAPSFVIILSRLAEAMPAAKLGSQAARRASFITQGLPASNKDCRKDSQDVLHRIHLGLRCNMHGVDEVTDLMRKINLRNQVCAVRSSAILQRFGIKSILHTLEATLCCAVNELIKQTTFVFRLWQKPLYYDAVCCLKLG